MSNAPIKPPDPGAIFSRSHQGQASKSLLALTPTRARITNQLPNHTNVQCLGALSPATHFKLHYLILLQVSEPITVDFGIVHEHVSRTILRLDTPKTLLSIKPFNSAFSHSIFLHI